MLIHYVKILDVRDGLTREERVVLWVLHETQKERGDRNVPTAMLWGAMMMVGEPPGAGVDRESRIEAAFLSETAEPGVSIAAA